ncbi:MAG: hypothetical protein KBT20_00605 [Bacteroidales bacterium]|nr:hypothetical protein [Candidatus Liminaster caballi]
MYNVTGTKIISAQYGIGTIISISDTKVMTITFPEVGEKRFMYPDAFCKSIQSEDTIIQEEAEAAWLVKLEKKKAEEAARKEAESQKKRESRKTLTPEEIESKKAELQHILEGINNNEQFTESTSRIFIVHQGKTYFEEYTGSYIWAPASGIHHHERMTDIRKGDIIVNYANGAVQAISEALCDWFYSPRPSELHGYGWDNAGYRVQLRYQKLSNPVKLDVIQDNIINLRAKIYSSFDSAGNACQGYLYELETSIGKLIKGLILQKVQSDGVLKVMNRF